MYYIVKFIKENSVEMVPDNWVRDDGTCAWPTYNTAKKHLKAVEMKQPPDDTWDTFDIKILCAAVTYEDAQCKASQAQYTSDFNSDAEDMGKKKRRRITKPLRYATSESENSTDESAGHPQSSPALSKTFSHGLPPAPSLLVHSSTTSSKSASIKLPPAPPILASVSATTPTVSNVLSLKRPFRSVLSEIQVTTPTLPASKFTGRPRNLENFENLSQLSDRDLMEKTLAFQIRILKVVEDLRLQGKVTIDTIQKMPGNVSTGSVTECFDEMPSLPMNCSSDLVSVENFLKLGQPNQNLLVSYLSTTGGTSVDDLTRRILSRIFTNKFATTFSFTGRKGKTPFRDLRLKDVIFAAVRKHRFAIEATDHDLQLIIGDWLRYSPERSKIKRKTSKQYENDDLNTDDTSTL